MLLYCIFCFSLGFLLMAIIHFIFTNETHSKICKICKYFMPYSNVEGILKGICKYSCDTYATAHLLDHIMSCGHFEYTEAIQAQTDKNNLEKCFKK